MRAELGLCIYVVLEPLIYRDAGRRPTGVEERAAVVRESLGSRADSALLQRQSVEWLNERSWRGWWRWGETGDKGVKQQMTVNDGRPWYPWGG